MDVKSKIVKFIKKVILSHIQIAINNLHKHACWFIRTNFLKKEKKDTKLPADDNKITELVSYQWPTIFWSTLLYILKYQQLEKI